MPSLIEYSRLIAVQTRSIKPGQLRVAISEFADPENTVLDPYHNAGYTHLYCLEKFCNLPSLLAETNVIFLPAGKPAKELSFPAALDIPQQEACLQWVNEARQSWKNFKSRFPIAEERPRYTPRNIDRLLFRLELAEPSTSNKRRHDAAAGNNLPDEQAAAEPAPKRPRTQAEGPYHQLVPQSGGFGVRPDIQRFPLGNGQPTGFQGQLYQANAPGALPDTTQPAQSKKPLSPGQELTRLAENAQAELRTEARKQGEEPEEDISAQMVRELADLLAQPDPAAPAVEAGPPECAGPEQSIQPEQVPNKITEPVTAVKIPVVRAGRRSSRRSSAPPVLGVQNARIRKSAQLCRRGSKLREVPVTQADLEELQKGR
ncbi:hypothetical protein J7T55_009035 [Diaporthe amygdali]|uniref:uncharacterized protein n=1 Tax=Phomopsis amygdali TaxID=1214568 RepID=UPI0022FE6412|nr:uncharacterized protein J7T55_009035 [Diaporthe amygdali]KAJ0118252.1 hypothetical protein J7T55_009035 [Diaporthe amygdali]